VNIDQKLPRSVQEVADVIGRDAALLIVNSLPRSYSESRRRSGRVVFYVPKVMQESHPVAVLIGPNLAEKLCKHFGGEIVRLAACCGAMKADRDSTIMEMKRSGDTPQCIAREFGITDRQVRNILREMVGMDQSQTPANTRAA
jgi:hypothetical protein